MSKLQSHRLNSGGQIDRGRPLAFSCNGRAYMGYVGDTLASALLANGVRVVGRSFKFHRPRGILSAGVEEPNALFRVENGVLSTPLVRATLQPLVDGLVATTENAWPGIHFDLGRILDYTRALWPVSFYHKTFIWPSWKLYEGSVRRLAGLGRLPVKPDRTEYSEHNLHCDVLVIGGGRSGIAAALAACHENQSVVLAEMESRLGGSLNYEDSTIAGEPAIDYLASALHALASTAGVRILFNTTVAGIYDHNVLLAVDRSHADDGARPAERIWKIRAKQVVMATGAIEQPLVFCNNDRPGIILAAAVRRYLRQYAVAAGRSIVVATNNDDAYRTAFALVAAGICVPLVVDARPGPSKPVAQIAAELGLEIAGNAVVVDTAGSKCLSEVAIRSLSDDGRSVIGGCRQIACDALAVSGGWCPSVHLFSQAGGRLRYDRSRACFVPDRCPDSLSVVGSAAGDFGRDWSIRPIRRSPVGRANSQWVDLRHDVTAADIELAVRENYSSVEHMKRYTTTGMSVDQGKTANLNAISILADLTGSSMTEVGTTTFRPVFSPVSFGAIAAGNQCNFYQPRRLLPAHEWHVKRGAIFDDYAGWQRPVCYPRNGEDRNAAIARESRTVRNAVGLFDASPLGKIEIKGPDAATFLNRIYINNVSTISPGRIRYGVMLNENGILIDDGVVARIAVDHYLVCTTSSGAERIASWLDEWHQCEWPDLSVVIAPVTSQWAVLTLAGPNARELLSKLDTDIDFSRDSFPHLSYREGQVANCRARVQRVSFSGEMSFEVSVPARCAGRLLDASTLRGTEFGIQPIGIESILLLRIEKGFLHVGTDTDGTTNPFDVGFGEIIDRKADDFIGKRSLMRSNDRRRDRRQLVGVLPMNPGDELVAGAHLIQTLDGTHRTVGFITSAGVSPILNRSIGLGLLESGFSRKGEIVRVFDFGRVIEARIVDPAFYDPSGARMNG